MTKNKTTINKTSKTDAKSMKHHYFLYGKHPVISALNNSKRKIIRILCTNKIYEEYKKLFVDNKITPEIVLENQITSELGSNYVHQGIIALTEPLFLESLSNVDLSAPQDRIAILDRITDPQNLGAIIRSAAAFNITKIILPYDNSAEENGTIAKAASGALELVKIIKVTNLKHTINILKDNGFWIAGLDASGENTIKDISDIKKLAIIVGAEGKGMRRLTLESCDFLVRISIAENVESLNASVAASIIFHATKL